MSTPEHGLTAIIADAASAARAAMNEREAELRQLDLEDPLTGEELLVAKSQIGMGAGRLAIVAKARENRRGRPPGARNKATDDMRRYLLQFGPDPLVAAMRLQGEDPLILAELWGCKPLEVVDRQLRARELVSPYMASKRPVAVDMTFSGVADLIIEGVTHSREEIENVVEGEFLPLDDASESEAA